MHAERELTWLGLHVGVPGLILMMMFIVGDLAYRNKAGKFGTMVLFGALGLGVFGFVLKTVISHYLV